MKSAIFLDSVNHELPGGTAETFLALRSASQGGASVPLTAGASPIEEGVLQKNGGGTDLWFSSSDDTHLRAAWPRFRAILRDRQMTRLSALSIRTFEGCSEVVVEP